MKPGAGDELHTDDGGRLHLGELLKSGGAGSVHRLREGGDRVAKIYHPDVDHAVYERKLRAMLRLSPRLPPFEEGGRTYVQIAWPQSLLHDARGRFVGFTMPVVDFEATAELELVMQERQARAAGLATGLGAKVTLAANLAAVIAELHRQQHRVVDLKPVNLRFYRRSLYLAMLDCDGFSIQGEGERFPAPQYTGDYLAPELQRGGITLAGEEAQDRFALAVIVFQLLNFGIHPFTGRPRDDSVPTDVPSRIAARLHAYGPRQNTQLLPNPGSGHLAFPPALRGLFERAFEGPPAARPTPLEWAELLRGYAQRDRAQLVVCGQDDAHQHFAGHACAACERQALIAKVARGGEQARAPRPAPVGGVAPAAPNAPRATRLKRPPLPASAVQQARKARRSVTVNAPVPPPARQSAAVVARGKAAVVHQQAQQQLSRIVGVVMVIVVIAMFGFRRDPPAPVVDETPVPALRPPPPPTVAEPAAPVEFDRVDTLLKAYDVARARAGGDGEAATAAMAVLRGDHPAPVLAGQEAALLAFGGRLMAADDYTTDLMRRSAEFGLQDDAHNAGYACQWGWLVLAQGHAQAAQWAFVRTLWSEPGNGCGWLGLAAALDDQDLAVGAMVQANLLLRYDAMDSARRDAFVAVALRRGGLDTARYREIVKKAAKLTLP